MASGQTNIMRGVDGWKTPAIVINGQPIDAAQCSGMVSCYR